MKKFWMVTLDGGNAPTARHATLELAKAEAARLSAKNAVAAHVVEHIATCQPRFDVAWSSPESEPKPDA